MRALIVPSLFGLLALAASSSPAQNESKPERIGLWNGKAPIGNGKFQDAEVWITVHRPKTPNGARAPVICPGGSYGTLVTSAEEGTASPPG